MNKRQRIKELETRLRLTRTELRNRLNIGALHAHHNNRLVRYVDIVRELEKISIKWKIKKFIRRIKLWLKFS